MHDMVLLTHDIVHVCAYCMIVTAPTYEAASKSTGYNDMTMVQRHVIVSITPTTRHCNNVMTL